MAEISEIVSKEAVESIKQADKAIILFDTNMQKSLTDLVSYAKELKEAGLSFKDLNAISQKMASTQQKTNDTQKQAEKILRDTEKAAKAQAAATEKLAAKEKEHNAALQMEVKSIKDAQAQNKALTIERNKSVTTYGKQSQAVKDLNAKITQNTEFMRANGTAMDKQRMNIGNYGSALGGIKETLKTVGTAMLAAFSFAAISSFFKESYKAYEEQEIANKKLLYSLGGNKTAFHELAKQAGELQSKLGIPDETINQIQMLAAETGKSTKEIKKITEASIALSTITGEDLQSSYMKLNATFTGSAGRLNRMDSDFGKLTKTQLENGGAIDLVISKYGKIAEQAVVPTKLLAVAYGEFLESVGAGGTIFDGAIKGLAKLIDTMALSLKTVKQIKKEAAEDQSANRVNAGLGEVEFLKNKFSKGGLSDSDASKKALATYSATQQNTINAATQRNIELMKEYKVSSFEVQKQKVKEIGINNLLIKATQEETYGVKKELEVKEDISKKEVKSTIEKTKTITIQKTAYEQLSEEIARLIKITTEQLTLTGKSDAADQQTLLMLSLRKAGIDKLAQSIINLKEIEAKPSTVIDSVIDTGGMGIDVPDYSAKAAAFARSLPKVGIEFTKDQQIESAQITSDAIFAIVNNSQNAEFDLKMSNLEKEKNAKLSNAKLTEAQKAKIEADYAKKTAKLKTEQFKKEKAASIVQAIINTAIAISKANAVLPPGNIPAMILAGIAGAAQIAVIASQKVPQFDKGTMSAPSQFIAGEQAPEFVGRSGNWQLITKPTHFKNYAGATVISSKETKQMIEQGMRPDNTIDMRPDIARMEQSIVKTIQNKTEWHISTKGQVSRTYNGHTKTYHDKYIQWAGKAN